MDAGCNEEAVRVADFNKDVCTTCLPTSMSLDKDTLRAPIDIRECPRAQFISVHLNAFFAIPMSHTT